MQSTCLIKPFTIKTLLAGLALVTVATAAQADWVELDNGDRLSGRIVSLLDGVLILETAYAGTLKLPRERISRLESTAPVRVRLADGTEFDGLIQSDAPEAVRVRISALAETEPVPLAQIGAINPPRDPGATRVSARVSAGGSATRGNTDARTLHLSGEAVARNPVNRVTLDAALNRAAQDGAQTASNARAGLKYDHFVSSQAYLYANTRLENDGEADLDLRTSLGVGAGWQIADTPRRTLAVEGGLSYVNEDYGNAPDQRFPGARLALKYEEGIWQDSVRLFHDSDLLISLDSLRDTLLRTRTGVRVPVADRLSLGTSVHYDFDNVPAPGKKKTDTALIFQLDYAL